MGKKKGKEQRRFVRFPVMCRVEYAAAGELSVGFTGEVSSGGFFLKQARGLTPAAQVSCVLHLGSDVPPVFAQCLVRRVTADGAGLEFAQNDAKARTAVRKFINERLVVPLEAQANATPADVERYALYCVETGRPDEGLDTFRRAITARPDAIELYEGLAALLLDRAGLEGPAAELAGRELEGVLVGAAMLGPSETLHAVGRELEALRTRAHRRKQDERERFERELEDALTRSASRPPRELRKKSWAGADPFVVGRAPFVPFPAATPGAPLVAQAASGGLPAKAKAP